MSERDVATAAEVCEHYWAWVSPAGTSKSARICMSCHQPDPEWLNHTTEVDLGHDRPCVHCEFAPGRTSAQQVQESRFARPLCGQCGPGYRIGDPGCRHAAQQAQDTTGLSERVAEVLARHDDWIAKNVGVGGDIEWRDQCECGADLGPSLGFKDPSRAHRTHVAAILAALLAPTDAPRDVDTCPDFWPDGRHLDPPTDSCVCAPRDEPGLAERADAWDQGYTAGHSNAMRRMSDEPKAPTSPNPYRALLDDSTERGEES